MATERGYKYYSKEEIDETLNKPKCTVATSTQTTLSDAIVPYDTFSQKVGDFTLSSGVLTVPKTGYYLVSAKISGSGTVGWIHIYANDVRVSSSINRTSSSTYHSVVSDPVLCYLEAGQTIYVKQSDTGYALNSGMPFGANATTLTAIMV